jgi:hypothetical protein
MRSLEEPSLSARLRRMTEFLPIFCSPGFSCGTWMGGPGAMPFFAYSEPAGRFFQTAQEMQWVLPDFDWSAWAGSEEAQRLRNDEEALAGASLEQLSKLLTAAVRRDRFCEGAMAESFDSGLVTGVLRRMAAIEAELSH